MRILEAGCFTPLGVLARVKDGKLHFQATLNDPFGYTSCSISKISNPKEALSQIDNWVKELMGNGGEAIMLQIRNS